MPGLPLTYVTTKGWQPSHLSPRNTTECVHEDPLVEEKAPLPLEMAWTKGLAWWAKVRSDFIPRSTLGHKLWCNMQLKPKVSKISWTEKSLFRPGSITQLFFGRSFFLIHPINTYWVSVLHQTLFKMLGIQKWAQQTPVLIHLTS